MARIGESAFHKLCTFAAVLHIVYVRRPSTSSTYRMAPIHKVHHLCCEPATNPAKANPTWAINEAVVALRHRWRLLEPRLDELRGMSSSCFTSNMSCSLSSSSVHLHSQAWQKVRAATGFAGTPNSNRMLCWLCTNFASNFRTDLYGLELVWWAAPLLHGLAPGVRSLPGILLGHC